MMKLIGAFHAYANAPKRSLQFYFFLLIFRFTIPVVYVYTGRNGVFYISHNTTCFVRFNKLTTCFDLCFRLSSFFERQRDLVEF